MVKYDDSDFTLPWILIMIMYPDKCLHFTKGYDQ